MTITLRHPRRGVLSALAVIAVAAPASAALATPASAATTGFSTVEKVSFAATALTSPTAGSVYLAGVDAGVVHLALHTATGTTAITVSGLPAGTTPGAAQLATSKGVSYLLVTGTSSENPATLYRLKGATATKIALPTTAGGQAFVAGGLTGGPSGLFVIGSHYLPGTPVNGAAVARFDGTAWTMTSDSTEATYNRGAVVGATMLGSSPAGLFGSNGDPTQIVGLALDGSTWTQTRQWEAPKMGSKLSTLLATGSSVADHTAWGYSYDRGDFLGPVVAPKGECFSNTSTCIAPQWPVTAATKRADGSVVLGGADAIDGITAAAPGGFAVVKTPGAAPVAVSGTNGDIVVDLEAEATGSTVWALTKAGSTTTLQVYGESSAPTKPTKPCHKPPKPPKRHVHHWHHNH